MTTITIKHHEADVRRQLRPVVVTVVAMKIAVAILLLAACNLSSPLVADQQVAALADF